MYISFITHLDTDFRGIQKQAAVADECQLNLISFMYSLLSLTFLINSLICRETEEIMKMFCPRVLDLGFSVKVFEFWSLFNVLLALTLIHVVCFCLPQYEAS